MPELRPDLDLSSLDAGQLAAIKARSAWLDEAAKRARDLGQTTVKQIPPPGDWDTGIVRAGRFFGKSRMSVEWGWWECWRVPGLRFHALAPTLGDVRRTVFEGESGYLAKVPKEIIKAYRKDDKELHFTNGSMVAGFSMVEEADRLRGPQCHAMSIDEAAAADRPRGNLESAYKVAALGCRLPYPDGTPSRKLITTTPKPIPFLKRLERRPGTIVIRGSSYENVANVSASAMREVLALEGTTYGKQEIHGDYIDEEADQSIFKRSWFKLWPADKRLPVFLFILESYDTAFEEENFDAKKQEVDFTAKLVLGVFNIAESFNEAERRRMGLRGKYGALICEFWMERLGFPDLLDRAREEHRMKWGAKPGRKADLVLIENKGSGISLRQTMSRWGVPTWPFNPGNRSKTVRAHGASPVVRNGAIFIPESQLPERQGLPRNWVEPLLEQVCAFQGEGSVEHDDAVDVLVQAIDYLQARDMLRAEPEQKFADPEEKKEADEREAQRLYGRQQAEQMENPYG